MTYRVYCLDGASRFLRAEWIKAATDEDALEQARGSMGDCMIAEVWQRDRRVGRIGPEDSDVE